MSVEQGIQDLETAAQEITAHTEPKLHSPIDRADVARMFGQEAPRPIDATYRVIEKQREAVMADPQLAKLLGRYADVLTSQNVEEAIRNGLLTYTMYKPNLGKATIRKQYLPEEDEVFLVDKWGRQFENEGCRVISPVSTVMTPETYEAFYAGNKEWQSGIKVETFPSYTVAPESPEQKTLFEQVKKVMLSGPTTPGVVHSIDGNAIQRWRKILGPSNPDKDRNDPKFVGSFRSLNATASNNTLVHGSGKIEEAIAETQWYAQRILDLIGAGRQV